MLVGGENITIKGFADITLFTPDGIIKDTRHVENLITLKGFDTIIQKCFSTQTGSSGSFNYIAIGSGTSSASTSDTALGSEAARAQAVYTHTDGQTNVSLVSSFNAGTATGSISEYGVFNATSNGQMFNRATFPTFVKGATEYLQMALAFSFS